MRLCSLLRPSYTGLLRLLFLAPLCLCRLGGLLLLRDGQRRLLPGGLGRRLGGKRVRKAWRKALLFLLHGSSLGTLQCAFVSARKAATFHVWPVAFTYRGAEAVKRQRRCEQWPLQSAKARRGVRSASTEKQSCCPNKQRKFIGVPTGSLPLHSGGSLVSQLLLTGLLSRNGLTPFAKCQGVLPSKHDDGTLLAGEGFRVVIQLAQSLKGILTPAVVCTVVRVRREGSGGASNVKHSMAR